LIYGTFLHLSNHTPSYARSGRRNSPINRISNTFWQDLRCPLDRSCKKNPHKRRAVKEPLRKKSLHRAGGWTANNNAAKETQRTSHLRLQAGRQEHPGLGNQESQIGAGNTIMSTRGWRVGGLPLTAAAQPRILLLWRVFVLGLRLGFSDFTFSVFSLGFWQDVHLFALSQKKNRDSIRTLTCICGRTKASDEEGKSSSTPGKICE